MPELPEINNSESVQNQAEKLAEFSIRVKQALNAVGARVIFSAIKQANQSVTGTETEVEGMSGVFRSNGGLVLVMGTLINDHQAVANTITERLYIDGIERQLRQTGGPSNQIQSSFMFPVALSEGEHFLKFTTLTNAGTNNVLLGSDVYVLEIYGG